MKGRTIRWLTAVIVLLALLAGGLWYFREPLLLWAAPKLVLPEALSEAVSDLEERFQAHPLQMLKKYLSPQGQYTADMMLHTENDILGPIHYDMTIRTNGTAPQLWAEGSADAGNRELDLKLYLDADYAAVSSEELVKGNFYGITYDTFAQDIREIPLLDYFVSDRILSQWNASVQSIQKAMAKPYTFSELPQLTEEETQVLLTGLMALPCEVEKTTVAAEDGYLQCRLLSYHISGETADLILENTPYGSGGTLDAKFYLLEKKVIKVTLSCTGGGSTLHISLDLGEEPEENPLHLQVRENQVGISRKYDITIDTKQTQPQYAETWKIISDTGRTTISFEWDPLLHELLLIRDESEATSVILQESGRGLKLESSDLQELLSVVIGKPTDTNRESPMSFGMTLRTGAQISAPPYRNLDQWSIEDFLILLEGLGSLIGIRIS